MAPAQHFAATVLLVAALAVPAARPVDAESVDLQLVLAADVSISIDNDEFRLQREGYAAAITDPSVLGAIGAAPHHGIALSYVEWSGPSEQRVVVDWTIIRERRPRGHSPRLYARPRVRLRERRRSAPPSILP